MGRLLDMMRSASLAAGSIPLVLWCLIVIAVAAAPISLAPSRDDRTDLELWVFAATHELAYAPILEDWNAGMEAGARGFSVGQRRFGLNALQSRLSSSFFAGVHTADLIEVERSLAGQLFSGPIEEVGFVELTDRLEEEGLLERINPASFGPWTSRGRIFGIPHDVHPVMLAYRADLVEAAGVDVSRIETWDDFAKETRSLVQDLDGDGAIDRYPLAVWPRDPDKLDMMLLQGGGRLFDDEERPVLNSPRNFELVARLVSWCVGPNRFTTDVPEGSAAGNQLKLEGHAVFYPAPDWASGVWQNELPSLAGKMKLMPMPAWEPGGRRTSVWGGTMLGLAKTSTRQDDAWELAKHLYLSKSLAESMFRTTNIITPIREHWGMAVFDEPNPYFSGQAIGRAYIQLADEIPSRTGSPFARFAIFRVGDAAQQLLGIARDRGIHDPAELEPIARELLDRAQRDVEQRMANNAFLSAGSEP